MDIKYWINKQAYLWVEKVFHSRYFVNHFHHNQCGVPRVHHHVPGVAVETVGPVVVALCEKVRVR